MKSIKIVLLTSVLTSFTSSIALANPPGNFTNERLEPQMGNIQVDRVSETFKKAWKEMGGEVADDSSGASNNPNNSSSSDDRTNNDNSSNGGGNQGNTPGGNNPE